MVTPEYDILPYDLDTLTLGQWIRFYNETGKRLDEESQQLEERPADDYLELDRAELHLDRLYHMAAYFTGRSFFYARKEYSLPDVARCYNDYLGRMFDGADALPLERRFDWKGITWVLPPVELTPTGGITFGEFIDSKSVVQDIEENKLTRWELIHQVAAIFLRPEGEEHRDEHLERDGDRLMSLMEMPMRIALTVGNWFDAFNEHLKTSFTVFQPSGVPSGAHSRKHFESWGWINFLKTIAVTKVFDIPNSGHNSIECARRASCFDVLIYAGEEKSNAEAQYWDMKAANK